MSRDRAIDLITGLLMSEFQNFTGIQRRENTSERVVRQHIPVSLIKTDSCITITAEMPGFTKDSIDIDFHNNKVVISGNKPEPTLVEDEKVSFSSIKCGDFTESVGLAITVNDKEKVHVNYENGVLKILINLENNENTFKINLKDE